MAIAEHPTATESTSSQSWLESLQPAEPRNVPAEALQVFNLQTITEADKQRLESAKLFAGPYEVARKEVTEMATFFEGALTRIGEGTATPEAFKAWVISQLTARTEVGDIAQKTEILEAIFEPQAFMFEDWLTLAHGIIAEKEILSQPPQYLIFNPKDNTVMPYIRPEANRLLHWSRMLGLVPFTALEKLRTLSIKCIGASVAAQTLDMLVSYGAENITFADNGRLEASNGPRLTPEMAAVSNLGQAKAEILFNSFKERNPYGNFQVINGIVTTEDSKTRDDGSLEVNLQEFVTGAGLVIEVTDNGEGKLRIHQGLVPNDIPLLFVADTSIPVTGLENPAKSMFNRENLTQKDWDQALERITQAPDPLRQAMAKLLAITEMLGSDIPSNHLASTMLLALFAQPFLSQDPAGTRINAASSSTLVLEYLQGNDLSGHNYSAGELELLQLSKETHRSIAFTYLQAALGKTA